VSYEPECREFESRRARHTCRFKSITRHLRRDRRFWCVSGERRHFSIWRRRTR